jgi:hypothetical protein
VIWIGIAVVGLIAVALVVRRAFAAGPSVELGAMSGQWIAEHRADQLEDLTTEETRRSGSRSVRSIRTT